MDKIRVPVERGVYTCTGWPREISGPHGGLVGHKASPPPPRFCFGARPACPAGRILPFSCPVRVGAPPCLPVGSAMFTSRYAVEDNSCLIFVVVTVGALCHLDFQLVGYTLVESNAW